MTVKHGKGVNTDMITYFDSSTITGNDCVRVDFTIFANLDGPIGFGIQTTAGTKRCASYRASAVYLASDT
jgi:hypothetical protein